MFMTHRITEPLSVAQLRAQADTNGYVTVIIPVDFSDLIDCDIEALNNLADDLVLGPLTERTFVSGLMDLSYAVVGHTGDTVHIQVVADASGVLSELSEDDEALVGNGEHDDRTTDL